MNEKPDGWNQELYEKLNFDFLIECAENNKIDEWNALYLEYLKSEWKRLYPEREWDRENMVELVEREPTDLLTRNLIELEELLHYKPTTIGSWFKRLSFREIDFREAISRSASFNNVHLEGAKFTMAHLEGADFSWANLEGADFSWANLEGSDFSWANLEGSDFRCAHLERADFSWAHLKEGTFEKAHLERADFRGAHLDGEKFKYAIVDGETLFTENHLDEKTDFTGTALSATRIDPNLRTRLERNIREIQWKDWYKKPKFYPYLGKIPDLLWGLWCMTKHLLKDPPASSPKKRFDPKDYSSLENSTLYLTLKKILSWTNKSSVTTKNAFNQDPEETKDEKNKWETKYSWIDTVINGFVRLFWCLTDYGSSTKRVIGVFFVWNIFWACIYQFLLPLQPGPMLENASTMVLETPNIITAVMQTNLMMFSITDVATRNLDYPALIFVTVQIVIGYFILAALITRLGIMFQNLSP